MVVLRKGPLGVEHDGRAMRQKTPVISVVSIGFLAESLLV